MSGKRAVEMSFWDHLEELRWRLVRMVIYVAVAMALSWAFRNDLMWLLRYPAEAGAEIVGAEHFSFRIFEAPGGIILMMYVSLVAGAIIASPLIFMELWLFVEPALEPGEKRWAVVMIPAATGLFVAGVIFCYWISPRAFGFFLSFNRGLGAPPELTLQPYLYLLMRLLLVFGLSFELPLVLMFLARVGLVTKAQLLRFWRHAIVIIFVFAAIATPTTDPLTFSFLAAPMIGLYALSILLCGLVEKRRREDEEGEQGEPDRDPAEGLSEPPPAPLDDVIDADDIARKTGPPGS